MDVKISEIAERSQTPVDTVRYYERAGLVPAPARTASNYRSYSEAHVQRLDFIRRCRALDMSLDEIRRLMAFCDAPDKHCGEVNALIEEHLLHVETRLRELEALSKALKQLRQVCRTPARAESCRILKSLRGAQPRKAVSSPSHTRLVHRRR